VRRVRCIRLQKVLLTQNLQKAGNVILVELDYPRRTSSSEVKKQNNELQLSEYKDFQQFILLMGRY
jgi:hypothetical protein